MKRLLSLLLVLFILSCGDNIEEYVTNDISLIHSELQTLGPVKSTSFKLNNSTNSKINSSKNLQLEIPTNTLFSQSELIDIPYQLDLIELNSFSNYITSNITHESNQSIKKILYSFYISAKDINDANLSIMKGNAITVKIPTNENIVNVELARGIATDNSIEWSFNPTTINTPIVYTEWEELNPNGTLETIKGYEFKITELGWYTLAEVSNSPTANQEICIRHNNEFSNSNNTLVFILFDSQQLLLPANRTISSDFFCNVNVPSISNSPLEILSISYIDEEKQFYYDSKRIINPNSLGTVILDPIAIEKDSLEIILNEL